jgi:hypothetical protein
LKDKNGKRINTNSNIKEMQTTHLTQTMLRRKEYRGHPVYVIPLSVVSTTHSSSCYKNIKWKLSEIIYKY